MASFPDIQHAIRRTARSLGTAQAGDARHQPVDRCPWPVPLRVAGYVTALSATAGIAFAVGTSHPLGLAAAIAGAIAFTLAFHVLSGPRDGLPGWAGNIVLAGQLGIGIGLLFLANCMGAGLLIYILAAELQLRWRLRWAIVGTVGLWLLTVLSVWIGGVSTPYGSFAQFVATSPAGFVFVAAFTYGAVRERQQRFRATQLLEELNEAHDSLGHYLTVINVQLETAKKLYGLRGEAGLEAVKNAKALAGECLNEVRRSVAALRPAPLELGLSEALAYLIESLRKTTDVAIHLESHGSGRLRPEVEAVTYRVIQEALTNVRKHAAASNVWLRLDWDSAELSGSVRDDGRGGLEAGNFGSFGLESMRERLATLGGTLATRSVPGEGFELSFNLPEPLRARTSQDDLPAEGKAAIDAPVF
jgi:signal transduction histidine kinase